MIAIGRYLVFIICLAELTQSFDNIFNEESNFFNYILELHNAARTKHGVLPLERDYDVSKIINYIYILYK